MLWGTIKVRVEFMLYSDELLRHVSGTVCALAVRDALTGARRDRRRSGPQAEPGPTFLRSLFLQPGHLALDNTKHVATCEAAYLQWIRI